MLKHKSILMVVTSHEKMTDEHKTGLWFEEFAIPAGIFIKAGNRVTVASVKGGAAPIDPRSMPENSDDRDIQEALDALKHTRVLADIDLAEFDAVFFPGGHGTMYDLPVASEVGKTIGEFMESGRAVGAVCHGPAAFVGATLSDGTSAIKGRKLTGFTNDEEQAVELAEVMPFLLQSKLSELGAEFVTSPNWQDNVVVDGKLVTGQNPQSSGSAARALLQAIDHG